MFHKCTESKWGWFLLKMAQNGAVVKYMDDKDTLLLTQPLSFQVCFLLMLLFSSAPIMNLNYIFININTSKVSTLVHWNELSFWLLSELDWAPKSWAFGLGLQCWNSVLCSAAACLQGPCQSVDTTLFNIYSLHLDMWMLRPSLG